jgi:hypothetical protein
MFTMLALLTAGAPDVPIETIAEKTQALFGGDPAFRFEYEVLPFNTQRNLILRWKSWTARLFCETAEDDEEVAEQSARIAKILGKGAPAGIADATRRVRAVFYDDPEEQYIDEMVEITAMLRKLPGALVFDPQKNEIVR